MNITKSLPKTVLTATPLSFGGERNAHGKPFRQKKSPALKSSCGVLKCKALPNWRNGRRRGFKILRPRGRPGSSPGFGTWGAFQLPFLFLARRCISLQALESKRLIDFLPSRRFNAVQADSMPYSRKNRRKNCQAIAPLRLVFLTVRPPPSKGRIESSIGVVQFAAWR